MKKIFELGLWILLWIGFSQIASGTPTDEVRITIDSTDSVTVYIFMAEECVICQYYTLLLKALYTEYHNERLEFVGLFPNKRSKYKTIKSFQKKYALPFPLLTDHYRRRVKQFEIQVTPEVVVYNETQQALLYKGRIDNTFFRVGKRRRVTTTSELKDVLRAIQNHEPITTPFTTAVGCFISNIAR